MFHLLLLATLAAGATAPSAQEGAPGAPAPAPAAPSPAAAPRGPLTLDEALALASRQNPDLQLVRLQGEGAGVEAYVSYANVLPRLDLSIGFGYSYSGPRKETIAIPSGSVDLATGRIVFDPQWASQVTDVGGIGVANYSLGLQLQQPIFDGLRGPRLIQRARLGEKAAARQVDEAVLSLSFEVTRRFYEVVKADRNVRVLEETVGRSEEYARRAEALFGAGRLPKSETIAARVNLGNDRINLEAQRAAALQARADLAQLLALSPQQVGEVAASADVDSDALALREPPAAEKLLERARQARPAFARAQALLEQARLDRKIATADWWPQLFGTLGYHRAGPTFAGGEGVWGNPARQYVASAGLTVQWNLFDGRQTLAAQQRAAVAERTAEAQALQLALQVEADLARARARVIALGQAVKLAGENLKAAEEGVRLAQQRLEAGAATQLEVRDAALKLTQAKLTLVNARIDALVARADLHRAAGGAP